MNEEEVARNLVKFGDQYLAQPFRRYARVWLEADYEQAAVRNEAKSKQRSEASKEPKATESPVEQLVDTVNARYAEAVEREVIDDGEGPSLNDCPPTKGMLLHEQVVMHAHMQFICRLLQRADKLRFYLDQESGLRAAFMAAASSRVLNRTADAFYVQISKDGTTDQKRGLLGQSVKAFKKACAENPELDDDAVEILLVRRELDRLVKLGHWSDKWLLHPIADMREPTKLICWLTDIDSPAEDTNERDAQLEHAARLYRRASVTEVDRFFMQLRRALTMAERGVISASADRRLWFGKNAYKPGVLAKLVEIFRVYFNYCEVGDDKRTPAMRMGLARGPVAEEDILYFVPGAPPRRRAASEMNEDQKKPLAA